jgi:hypothetical protein
VRPLVERGARRQPGLLGDGPGHASVPSPK